MLENVKDARQAKRMENMQKRIDKLMEANEALKRDKADIERELIVCRAKLDRTGKYEADLKDALAQARDAKRSYDAAYKDLQIVRKQYTEQMNLLITEIKGMDA